MIGDISGATSIYIITGKTDMRKSINGLCVIVYDMMGQEIKYNADVFEARKTSEEKQEAAGKELPKVGEDKVR